MSWWKRIFSGGDGPARPSRRSANEDAAGLPARVRLEPDTFHVPHVGRTRDGRQFFLTTPFVADASDFLALYLFDPEGRLLDARIEDLGPREPGKPLAADVEEARYQKLIEELGLRLEPIDVAPFEVDRGGIEFGLIPQPPEPPLTDHWTVEAHPGNYLSFYPPWDGSYDT
jgi:hypothetical protein